MQAGIGVVGKFDYKLRLLEFYETENGDVRTQNDMRALLNGVFSGDKRSLARMISLAEANIGSVQGAMSEIYCRAGKAHLVGLTGVPGCGKSSLISELARVYRISSRRVGIVAVDPSSPFSGGAILGDRIRMAELTNDAGIFIRSLATRGNLGGLARSTLDAVDILDAAGFDLILIETVGVGQDEVDIANACHTVIVVSAPGLGDDVQAIKSGLLETADIHVISKADREGAEKAVTELEVMMSMGFVGRGRRKWSVPIIKTSIKNGEGISDLMESINRHEAYLLESGELQTRQREIAKKRILMILADTLQKQIDKVFSEGLNSVLEDTVSRQLDPQGAAHKLLRPLDIGS